MGRASFLRSPSFLQGCWACLCAYRADTSLYPSTGILNAPEQAPRCVLIGTHLAYARAPTLIPNLNLATEQTKLWISRLT